MFFFCRRYALNAIEERENNYSLAEFLLEERQQGNVLSCRFWKTIASRDLKASLKLNCIFSDIT